MNRRRFLLLGAGLGASAAALLSPWSPVSWRLLGTGPARAGALAERLRVALVALGAAPASAFSKIILSPGDAAVGFVGTASLWEVDLLCDDARALREHLERRRRADFAAGRTRFVAGWLVAETEVQVGALLAAGETP